MKYLSLKTLIRRLMDDGIITASTEAGAYQTLYHHLNNGNLELDYVEMGNRIVYFWTPRQYPSIAKRAKKVLRG